MLKRLLLPVLMFSLGPTVARTADRPTTNTAALNQLAQTFQQQLESRQSATYLRLLNQPGPAQARLNASGDVQLMFVDRRNQPRFYQIENLNAARTVNTDDVWPGGSAGFSLSGSTTGTGQLGIWDGGGVRTSHQEFGGRVTQKDSPAATHYHATHVAGTMVASGVVAGAKGMSYAANLDAYDWTSDEVEMAAAGAAGMNVSNHSYGFVVGWRFDTDWYWYGDIGISTVEDYGFGYYGSYVQEWDQIAYNAPYYLICKSAGNDRNDAGPGAGGGHYVWDGDWVWSTDTRDEDCGPDGYDCIGWKGTAKNILTIGAVNDISSGYSVPGDVSSASFSSWGPTDDGRIKPDIVANGVSLNSSMDGSDTDYASLSGTSMSSPNTSGSINLLARHYEATHAGETPLASTLKGIVIQTANEAGAAVGPDYKYGWGLLNTSGAAQLISDDISSPEQILEAELLNGETHEYFLQSDGLTPIRLTVAWTDPAGTPPTPALDPANLILVHDLDVRLEHVATAAVSEPYVLDPANPANAATTGDNFRDNVEQILVAAPAAGTYRITIGHKGTLTTSQFYSLVTSAPFDYCTDTDGDGYCAGDDNCPVLYNPGQDDADSDGVGDACDICPGFDDTVDADADGVPDGCDICPGFDDNVDSDSDLTPDGCDNCPNDPDKVDPGDCGCGVADTDTDSDGVPDCNDLCPGSDDAIDTDSDGIPDGCDICPGFDDAVDADADGVPDGCDICAGYDDAVDADADGVPDGCDVCPGFDDTVDSDSDLTPDGCDNCPDDPNKVEPGDCGCGTAETDTDADGVADCNDICAGFDDAVDPDADGVPSGCDNCPDEANPDQIDNNSNQIGDFCETCCRGRVGDANGSGEDEPTIGDVSTIIDMLFITQVDVACYTEADVNQSGGFDPIRDEISIGDVSYLIDYLFITGESLGIPDCITIAD